VRELRLAGLGPRLLLGRALARVTEEELDVGGHEPVDLILGDPEHPCGLADRRVGLGAPLAVGVDGEQTARPAALVDGALQRLDVRPRGERGRQG
jgi:hypothetical protein